MAGTRTPLFFISLFSCFLFFLGGTSATLCTDQCDGACTISKFQCDSSIVFGPMCGFSHGLCVQGCNAFCGAVDTCLNQCGPAFEECKNKAPNKIFKIQCTFEDTMCIVQCQQIYAAAQVGTQLSQAVSTIFPFINLNLNFLNKGTK